MARQRRPRHPPIAPPKFDLRTLTWLMIAFFVLIGFVILIPIYNSKLSASTLQAPRRFSDPKDIPDALIESLDAVVILGGGAPTSIDHPPIYVERRCDDAVQIIERWQQLHFSGPSKASKKKTTSRELLYTPQQSARDLPILCLSAGTAHLPQLLSKDGLPIWESTACASYLTNQKAIPPQSIYVETTSYDTIGNAFYARTTHTDISGWRRLLVVTNEFHMDRTISIFDWIFLDCISGKRKANQNEYQLYYLESPNVGLSEDAVQARKEREAASARFVEESLKAQYSTLQGVYHFLTHDHSLYTAHKLVSRGRGEGNEEPSESVKRATATIDDDQVKWEIYR